MILCDTTLRAMLPEIILTHRDESLVNPASIDIRIGGTIIIENPEWIGNPFDNPPSEGWLTIELGVSGNSSYVLQPGEFILASTLEHIAIPNGYAAELKLKSSRAREGFDHSLAFWVDPGWSGVLTMELRNATRNHYLAVGLGLKIGQLILHQLDGLAERPYEGKYNGAVAVEGSK